MSEVWTRHDDPSSLLSCFIHQLAQLRNTNLSVCCETNHRRRCTIKTSSQLFIHLFILRFERDAEL